MRFTRLLAAGVLATCLISLPAQALTLSGVAGINSATPDQTTTTPNRSIESSGSLGAAFGALASVSAMPFFELEGGLLFVNNKYDSAVLGNGTKLADTAISYKTFQIPVLLRFTGLPIVSAGLGLFYEKGTGSVTTKNKLTSSPEVSSSFADAGLSTANHGVVFDARANFPILPLFSFLVDVRYNHGLKNLGTEANEYKTRSYQILGGLAFSI